MSWLAFDIGGANVKVADGRGYARVQRFELWRAPEQLPRVLDNLISQAPPGRRLAVTMTGELCDCYPTRTAGVLDILAATEQVAGDRKVFVYLTDGRLVPEGEARQSPLLAAAANWRALAQFAVRFAPHGTALVIDVGSTTTDLVPVIDGQLRHSGEDDVSRLIRGELVYTGVTRTPLCAVAPATVYRGQPCPLAAEYFSTMLDVYLVLGRLVEDLASSATADGRPATIQAACDRLARQICTDRDQFSLEDARFVAESMQRSQVAKIGAAGIGLVRQMNSPPQVVIVSGAGEFLAVEVARRLAPQAEIVSLREQLGPLCSICAPAHALAILAAEMLP